jgi:hypothetical protein
MQFSSVLSDNLPAAAEESSQIEARTSEHPEIHEDDGNGQDVEAGRHECGFCCEEGAADEGGKAKRVKRPDRLSEARMLPAPQTFLLSSW